MNKAERGWIKAGQSGAARTCRKIHYLYAQFRPAMNIESHPFPPFLPQDARILMLGSFPPQPRRWSLEFYYPNFNNDFWRILGLIFFADKEHFILLGEKKFDRQEIEAFCAGKGIAMYDTACKVVRLKDNASDKFLQVEQATDIGALLEQIPQCSALVATGQKAAEQLSEYFRCQQPPLGNSVPVQYGKRQLNFYRMPSTSRAYPLALDKKAEAYRRMFTSEQILQ